MCLAMSRLVTNTEPLAKGIEGLETFLEMTVSIILPTYNRSASLVAAINSVLLQSHADFEVIVVDDGSAEDIASVVAAFNDERLRYVAHCRNSGAAAARNTGLGHAKGEFIAFQDSDDLWLPGKLDRQIKLMSSAPVGTGAVIGAKILYGRDSSRTYGPGRVDYAPSPDGCLLNCDDQLDRLLTENRVSLQNGLFRRNCLPDMRWFDVCAKANEDWDFAIRLAQHTRIHEDIEPVVLGFVSSDSISRNKRKEAIGILRILKKNRAVLSRRQKQKSLMLIHVGRYFYSVGKHRRAAQFIAEAVRIYPKSLGVLAMSIMRKLGWRKI